MGKINTKKQHKSSSSYVFSCRRITIWSIMTISLAFTMGVLYGTTEHYLKTSELILGLYMSWEEFFVIIGVAIWTSLSLIIFKRYK